MERVAAASISDNFLSLFGVAPAAGRQVSAVEDIGEWVRAVDISYELWQRRWHGDPAIVGSIIEVNNLKVRLVGVMPRGFKLYMGGATGIAPQVDVWYPGAPDVGTARACPVVAKLRAGVTVAAAQAAVDTFIDQFIAEHAASYRAGRVRLTLSPLADDVVHEVRPALVALGGAVAFVLLVACANLANLLLARATARNRELVIRAAIGASRGRLVRQLTIEALVLGCVGAVFGLLIAQWAVDLLLQLAPATLPRREGMFIDIEIAAFAAALSLSCTLVAGVLPAWYATQTDVAGMLKQDPASTRGAATTRGLLVASQLALSLILLVGTGLMARAFATLRDIPLGFQPHGVATMKVDLPPQMFRDVEQRVAFFDRALDAIRQLPGVDAVGIGLPVPLTGRPLSRRVSLGPGEPERVVSTISVFSGYPEVLRVPLRAGRFISTADRNRLDPVLLVDEGTAAEFWRGENPIGQRLLLSPGSRMPIWGRVVGIVGRVQLADLRHDSAPQLWMSYRAMPWDMDIAVRTTRDPRDMGQLVQAAVERLNPGRPIFDVRPLDDYVADASADTRFALFVLSVFALFAVVLTAIGVYGVVAYATARRTREIAVRLALGADARRIVALVLGEAVVWTAAGLAAGALGARVLTRFIESLLFRVAPTDALTFVAVALLLGMIALVATALPALRAVRVDPMLALRSE
jgi:putative ABC transport system permease protein